MRVLPLFTVIALTASPLFAAQSVVPAAYPASRYEKLKSVSPFALATPEVAPEVPKDSFTKDWVLISVNPVPNAQGVEQHHVSIMTSNQTERMYFFGNEPNKEGVSVVSVERSPTTGKSKVTLRKGNEHGVVTQDEMLIKSTPAGGNPAQPGAVVPGGRPPQAQMLNGRPSLNPVKQPMGRPLIPRPTIPAPQANNGAAPLPQPAVNAGGQRRRIRVINSKP